MRGARKAVIMMVRLLAAATVAGCSGSDYGPGTVTLGSVTVAPARVTLASGVSQAFSATAHMSDGSTLAATVTWSATGGSISGAGVYTAGSRPGEYIVVAAAQGSTLADTALVTIPEPPPPNLVAVEVTPSATTIASGQVQAFTAVGRLSDNSAVNVPVTWTATGGSVSGGGVFTAGNTPGAFLVIATEIGGAGLADTAAVTIVPALVAIEVSPSSVRLTWTKTQQFTAIGRLSDGSTLAVPVVWSTSGGGSLSGTGLYSAGYKLGSFSVIATQQGGTAVDSAVVVIHSGGGHVAPGSPTHYRPAVGVAHLCTSNQWTDEPVGLGGTVAVTAVPNVGLIDPNPRQFATLGPIFFPDSSGGVLVWCEPIWQAGPDLIGPVTLVIRQLPAVGSAASKIFTYQSSTNPSTVADYYHFKDFGDGVVTEVVDTLFVSPTEGANIWFKNGVAPP
jgi:hypothetical protein